MYGKWLIPGLKMLFFGDLKKHWRLVSHTDGAVYKTKHFNS